MKYILKNAVLINKHPEITPEIKAVAYSPAVQATETQPGIPEVQAVEFQPRKYKFDATVFIGIEGTPEGEFIQEKNFSFTVLGDKTLAQIEDQVLIEAKNFIDKNYNFL